MKYAVTLIFVLMMVLTGCRQAVDGAPVATNAPSAGSTQQVAPTQPPSYRIVLSTNPATLPVGESVLVWEIFAPDGSPVPASQVQLLRAQGDMNHAGMVPVIEEGRARAYATDQVGRYEMAFDFNMGGDWIISATATLTDGTVINGRLNTSVR